MIHIGSRVNLHSSLTILIIFFWDEYISILSDIFNCVEFKLPFTWALATWGIFNLYTESLPEAAYYSWGVWLISAWRRGQAPSAILAKPLSDCVTVFCLRQCKSRHFERLRNFGKIHAIFKQIEYLAFLTEVCVVMLWVTPAPRVVVLFVSSSNFSSTKLEDLPTTK